VAELPLRDASFAAPVRRMLAELLLEADGFRIGWEEFLPALLKRLPEGLLNLLNDLDLDLDLDLEELAGKEAEGTAGELFEFPAPLAEILRLEDLSREVAAGEIEPAVGWTADETAEFPRLMRAMYGHTTPHVLLIGEAGVGKSRFLEELARRAGEGSIDHLREAYFLRADASHLAPEDSRGVLQALSQHLPPAENLVLCLEGLAELLRQPRGELNQQLLRSLLTRFPGRIVATMTPWEYRELIASAPRLDQLFTRVELREPDEERAGLILRRRAEQLAAARPLTIPAATVRKAMRLTGRYLLCERFPAKAIRVLEAACETALYERGGEAGEAVVEPRHLIRVLSERTGIPEKTLGGDDDGEEGDDPLPPLRREIFGQEAIIEAVANELRLIQAGLTEPGKPASVLLLAGLTGVGKTELAKQIARVYSASRQLQVYTMGNFSEPHSVSGIIGVPPGYVGHDQGGRLINELNADPYGVFLLDEAEKAHPNVWKPFLNLFDEGWIVDQRGVKAYADRAIFILTTNAGDQSISQMTAAGKSEEEIIEHVKRTLARVRPERGGSPVFTPQFLARLHRILVFRPLDEAALVRIAGRQIERLVELWGWKREKQLLVPGSVAESIGREAHRLNEAARGQEGGRIVRKLIRDRLETPIQQAAARQAGEYRGCRTIEVRAETGGEGLPLVIRFNN
jgi:ATP-dependent Clp protease ATP-binding subunit ClpA